MIEIHKNLLNGIKQKVGYDLGVWVLSRLLPKVRILASVVAISFVRVEM